MSGYDSIGVPFIELQQAESTNNYATRLVHEGLAQSGTVVFTHDQTKGKGQRQKQWQSEAGKNIAMSLIVQPTGLHFSQAFLLSMATAVAAHRFFSDYAGEEAKIKWPNDLYWRDRKAGGILIENLLQGEVWKTAVVGIGLNINQTSFAGLETKAVSLKQITGQEHRPVELAKELCNHLKEAYGLLASNSAGIIAAYQEHLFRRNERVRLKQGNRLFEATIKEVTPFGELVVEHATEERFAVGEIEWVG